MASEEAPSVESRNSVASTARRAPAPSSRACLECRRKHVKCDARAPVCSLCERVNATCHYVESRRGTKGPGRRAGNNDVSRLSANIEGQSESTARGNPAQSPSSMWQPMPVVSSTSMSAGQNLVQPTAINPSGPLSSGTPTPPSLVYSDSRSPDSDGRKSPSSCNVDAYYKFFHNSHPMLPPYKYVQSSDHCPPTLRQVVEYIGVQYTPKQSLSSVEHFSTSELLLAVQAMPNSGYKVQAMILLCVTFQGLNDQLRAFELVQQCAELALQLKMNEQSFAIANSEGDKILEESWRRTWWELYAVNGMVYAFLRQPNFGMGSIQSNILLPTEESWYAVGVVPPELLSADQFQNRAFEDEQLSFSSSAYRIEAIRILGKVIAIEQSADPEQAMEDAETALTTWFLLLPPDKMSVIDDDGEVDEVLFQAHMITNACNIMLNLPRSNLASEAVDKAQIACAGNVGPQCGDELAHTHAAKAMTAAKNINNLISTTMEATKHTPFFICAIALSVVMQLSACSVRACRCLDPHQSKISMAIGALKAMGAVWPLATSIMHQIKATAKQVLAIGLKRSYEQANDENPATFNFDFIVNESMWSSAPISSSELFAAAEHRLY